MLNGILLGVIIDRNEQNYLPQQVPFHQQKQQQVSKQEDFIIHNE
jgi:hypothetical protein